MLFPATASPGVPTDPGRPRACDRSPALRVRSRCQAAHSPAVGPAAAAPALPGRVPSAGRRWRSGREAGTHGCGRSRLLVPGNETTQLRAGKRRRDTWVVDQKGLYFGNEATSPSASRCSPAGLSRVHRRREGRPALSPTLARSRDKTQMPAAHSHASHPHPPGRHRPLAGALVPRAPSPARRRRGAPAAGAVAAARPRATSEVRLCFRSPEPRHEATGTIDAAKVTRAIRE